jgi:ankyrin repeat protein
MEKLLEVLAAIYEAYKASQNQDIKTAIYNIRYIAYFTKQTSLKALYDLAFSLLQQDDAKHLKMLIEAQPSLMSVSDQYSNTLLISAIQLNTNKAIEALLTSNIYLYYSNNAGMTALHIAARTPSSQLFILIDKHYINYPKLNLYLEITDMHGYTPLLTASEHRNYQAAEWLLSKGANVNAIDIFYNNALMHAVYNNDYKLTELLLNQGIDTSEQESRYGYTALMEAAYYNYYKLLILLIKKNAYTEQLARISKNTYKTALQIAAEQKSTESCNILIASGASIPSFNNVYINSISKVLKSADIVDISCRYILGEADEKALNTTISNTYERLRNNDEDMDELSAKTLDAISMRVKNYKNHPLFHMLIPQIPSAEICNIIVHYACPNELHHQKIP